MFGATVLLVCVIGARFSNDSRVFLDGSIPLSAGWEWYQQIDLLQNKSFFSPPDLYELQAYCVSLMVLWGGHYAEVPSPQLLIQWLHFSPTPQLIWPMVGMAVRLALDVGVHRRKPWSPNWSTEDELRKRAFWLVHCVTFGFQISLKKCE